MREQLKKVLAPISVTEDGMVTSVREVQLKKAPSPTSGNEFGPILITEDGMVIEAREKHPLNAPLSIHFTESGMVTFVREMQ